MRVKPVAWHGGEDDYFHLMPLALYESDREQYGLAGFVFFQAEDGIRDGLVTGVQTCALPIYRARDRTVHRVDRRAAARRDERFGRVHDRSEERRVGKECRYRWSPYH